MQPWQECIEIVALVGASDLIFSFLFSPKYSKVVPGEGMPLSDNPSQRGDLIIQFDIHFPEKLSSEKKRLIKQALSVWPLT